MMIGFCGGKEEKYMSLTFLFLSAALSFGPEYRVPQWRRRRGVGT